MTLPCVGHLVVALAATLAQTQSFVAQAVQPTQDELQEVSAKLKDLEQVLHRLHGGGASRDLISDVAIYAKAAEWIVRHGEFYSDKYARWTVDGLDRGLKRARELQAGEVAWPRQTGRLCRGYVSRIDQSVQPYGLSIPPEYGKDPTRRWRLDVELHGRGSTLNEVSFLQSHDSTQPVPADQDFIQLDVFGRTNNGYRWAGETDVFEAIESVKRRYRIDELRIVLRGFSMGGAGAWHLGLHYPDKWCSVGPGAGFTDTKKYLKITEPLPAWQEPTLRIYDSEAYALNAFNLPIVAYGGEDDPQLAASREIKAELERTGVTFTAEGQNALAKEIPFLYLVGPKTGHKFHPESRQIAMDFHARHAAQGTAYFRDHLRFVTYSLKYPGAFGYTILRMNQHYRPATIEAKKNDEGVIEIRTANVTMLELSRGLGRVKLGDETYELETAAGGSLPTVLFVLRGDHWEVLDYIPSLGELRRNYAVKRPGLQGPIDDAFTGPFLCVRGTDKPWSPALADWAGWNLERFAREWDKYFRGKLLIKNDTDVTGQDLQDFNLILFGDPGSNQRLRDMLPRLPVQWTPESISVGDRTFSSENHALVMIYPNPQNARRYVVVNSGHTFHEPELKASNAQLFPRLGDLAVFRVEKQGDGPGFDEQVAHAEILSEQWKLTRPTGP